MAHAEICPVCKGTGKVVAGWDGTFKCPPSKLEDYCDWKSCLCQGTTFANDYPRNR